LTLIQTESLPSLTFTLKEEGYKKKSEDEDFAKLKLESSWNMRLAPDLISQDLNIPACE
jgi:hypothetical protein